jgi:signal transduction histidine kinase
MSIADEQRPAVEEAPAHVSQPPPAEPDASRSPRPLNRGERIMRVLTVNQWFTSVSTGFALLSLLSVVLGVVAITRLADARGVVVNHVDPAMTAALRLSNALVDQETGVRGYVLSGEPRFLEPYRLGRRQEQRASADLRRLTAFDLAAQVRADTARVELVAQRWHEQYAGPVIARIARDGRGPVSPAAIRRGNAMFSAVRAALERQQRDFETLRDAATQRHLSAVRFLSGTFIAIAVLMALGIATVIFGVRVTMIWPLRRISRQVRRVAQGEYGKPVGTGGPSDMMQLGGDIDGMRRRIVAELASVQRAHAQLDQQAQDLQRSNAELEQFAYVASHDLQEPLRKVASFCQLLEKRYKGQLDERGEQYIAFAVDGAKRMQALINDLLAFSRVGRLAEGEQAVVDMDDVLAQALASISTSIEETGAEIVAQPLPQVRGEGSLLAGVFQNLIGNALKFHGPERPRVEIGVERDGADWVFSCTDNGIGIEPDYAERIFMIFQRLHPKDVYAGTGIGLAMCRKIVEYHGGRIWLDTDAADGTTFRFTLPALEETPTP